MRASAEAGDGSSPGLHGDFRRQRTVSTDHSEEQASAALLGHHRFPGCRVETMRVACQLLAYVSTSLFAHFYGISASDSALRAYDSLAPDSADTYSSSSSFGHVETAIQWDLEIRSAGGVGCWVHERTRHGEAIELASQGLPSLECPTGDSGPETQDSRHQLDRAPRLVPSMV